MGRSPLVDVGVPQRRRRSIWQSIHFQAYEALIIISTSHHEIISGNGMPVMDIPVPSMVNLSGTTS